MRICQSLLLIWLALLSRVSAERPQTVVATIPSDGLLQDVITNGGDESLAVDGGHNPSPMKDFEVTGFITKSGDIFELPASRSMGSIEAREEPELEPGMMMCRYGTIVVYSDSDCNNFFTSSEILGRPLIQNDHQPEEDGADAMKPLRKKNKPKGNKRISNKNKNKKRNNRNRQQQQRKKALKREQNQRRRRNKLKNGGKRGNNSQKKNKQRVSKNRTRNGNEVSKTKNRNNNNVNKRRRINNEAERSDAAAAPLQFTILLNRH